MQNVPEQLAAAVSRYPDRLAATVRRDDGVDRFTYRQLDAMANTAASCLLTHGVRAGDRCAILAAGGPRWCAVYLGILRLGAIAVPFDTASTTSALRTFLHDSGARALVTSSTFQSVATDAAAGRQCVVVPLCEATRAEAASYAPLPPCPAVRADPAVIVYTETTGDAKGVALTHGELLAERDAAAAVANLDEYDSVLVLVGMPQTTAQIWGLVLPLSLGAQVAFLDTFITRRVLQALDAEATTVVLCFPHFLYSIRTHIVAVAAKGSLLARTLHRTRLRTGRRIRAVITGGAPCDSTIGRDLQGLGVTVVQADLGRNDDLIVLSSGETISPEYVEAHYQQSPFIREMCVLGIGAAGEPFAERLHATVVPDVDVFRDRRIVNVLELIRFELENLSQSLAAHAQVSGFDVTFEPLPRTATGSLKRHEILRRCQSSRPAVHAPVALEPPVVSEVEPHLERLVATIQSTLGPGVTVRADSSLELDLGLDSMDRVELLATLERRYGITVPEQIAFSAFLVRDLAEAFREAREHGGTASDPSWLSLLEHVEPTPALHALLAQRPLSALALYAIARIVVRALVRPHVEGIERLPPRGPFIIGPNHQSYLDPIVIATVLPLRVYSELFFLGAPEYFQSPLMHRLAAWLNVVPLDPDAYLMPAMRAGAFGLRHGKVLLLFPEGERSIDGGVKKFRKGTAILSRQHGAPIVPVAIDGLFEIWPRTRPLNWRKLLPWSGHRTTICFGEPLPPSDAVVEQTARLREIVERMWHGLER